MQNLSPELLDHFREFIYRQSSLCFSPSRLINLKMRLQERVNTRALPSYEDYLRLLQEDLEEFDALVEGITTKETYFFRLPEQFKALSRHVLPGIEESMSKEAQRIIVEEGWAGMRTVPIRVWSAGCSSGEEPYSIAMTLMDSLKYPKAWRVEILASDISREAVRKAGEGFYETNAFNRIPNDFQKKFVKKLDHGFKMLNPIKERISFRIFNLRHINVHKGLGSVFRKLDDTSECIELFERFDIVFCRNVMIYFDFDAQQQLIDHLYACLKPGGFLFTGDAELIRIYKHHFRTLELEGTYLYQKPEIENA